MSEVIIPAPIVDYLDTTKIIDNLGNSLSSDEKVSAAEAVRNFRAQETADLVAMLLFDKTVALDQRAKDLEAELAQINRDRLAATQALGNSSAIDSQSESKFGSPVMNQIADTIASFKSADRVESRNLFKESGNFKIHFPDQASGVGSLQDWVNQKKSGVTYFGSCHNKGRQIFTSMSSIARICDRELGLTKSRHYLFGIFDDGIATILDGRDSDQLHVSTWRTIEVLKPAEFYDVFEQAPMVGPKGLLALRVIAQLQEESGDFRAE